MSWWLSRFPGSNPEAPVLTRFPGFVPPPVFVDIGTLPSGFAQTIDGTSVASPLVAFADRTVEVFTQDAGLPAEVIGGVVVQYEPVTFLEQTGFGAPGAAGGVALAPTYSAASPRLAFGVVSMTATLRAIGIPASMIGGGVRPVYIPTWTPSGIVGGGLFGLGPIGYRRAYHGKLMPVDAGDGFLVYAEVPLQEAPAGIVGDGLFGTGPIGVQPTGPTFREVENGYVVNLEGTPE